MPFAPYDKAMLDAHSLSAVADLLVSSFPAVSGIILVCILIDLLAVNVAY